eukprot:s5755_g1.t1
MRTILNGTAVLLNLFSTDAERYHSDTPCILQDLFFELPYLGQSTLKCQKLRVRSTSLDEKNQIAVSLQMYDVLPAPTAVTTAREPVEECSPLDIDVAFSRGPESGRAAAAAAISAAASAVLAAQEAVEPLLREAEQSPKALRQRSESPPWNPRHSPMPRGLQRSSSSTMNGSVARSPSAPRFPAPPLAAVFVRPLVTMPVLGRMSPTAVPFVPSFGGSLTSLPPASVVAYPQGMSRSPSPGGTMPSLEATRQLSPREISGVPVYVGSPQHAQPVIVRRATSPQSTHGSVCLSPAAASVPENRSMAAAAWAAAASPQGMLTRSSSGVLATRTLPPATRPGPRRKRPWGRQCEQAPQRKHHTADVPNGTGGGGRGFLSVRTVFCGVAVVFTICSFQLVLLFGHTDPAYDSQSQNARLWHYLQVHEANLTALALQQRELTRLMGQLNNLLVGQQKELHQVEDQLAQQPSPAQLPVANLPEGSADTAVLRKMKELKKQHQEELNRQYNEIAKLQARPLAA